MVDPPCIWLGFGRKYTPNGVRFGGGLDLASVERIQGRVREQALFNSNTPTCAGPRVFLLVWPPFQ